MIRKALNIIRVEMSVFMFIFCSIFLLESQCAVLDDEAFELSGIKDDIKKILERLSILETENKELKKQLRPCDSKLATNSEKDKKSNLINEINHEHGLSSHQKRLVNPSGTTDRAFSPVAFTAVLTHALTLGPHQTIEYDKVISNVGNGYNPIQGQFSAPLKGIYIVSATICSVVKEIRAEIVVNGVQVAAIYGDDYDLGSHTLAITLEESDLVWVRHFSEATSIVHAEPDRYYSSFSVALITTV